MEGTAGKEKIELRCGIGRSGGFLEVRIQLPCSLEFRLF
jgi:hypothetical protein